MKLFKVTFLCECDYPSTGTTYSLIVVANSYEEAKQVALKQENRMCENDILDWDDTHEIDLESWKRKRKPQVVFM